MNEDIRTMLAQRAAGVPEPPALLDGVHRRVRRDRTRRRALAGAALALVLIAVGTVAWGVERTDDDHLVPADPPSTSSSPAPGIIAPAAPIGVGYLPKGFGRPTVALDSAHSWTFTAVRESPSATVEVQVSTEELAPRESARLKYAQIRTIDLQGTDATLSVVPSHPGWPDQSHQSYWGPYSELTYARKPGQWVRIEAYNSRESTVDPQLREADLRAIAAGLNDRATPVADLLRFQSLPRRLQIVSLDGGSPSTFGDRTAAVQLGYSTDAPASTNQPYGASQWDLPRAPIVVLVGSDGAVVPGLGAAPETFTTIRVDGHEVRQYPKGYPGRVVLTTTFGPDRRIALSAETRLNVPAPRLARLLLATRPGADFG